MFTAPYLVYMAYDLSMSGILQSFTIDFQNLVAHFQIILVGRRTWNRTVNFENPPRLPNYRKA